MVFKILLDELPIHKEAVKSCLGTNRNWIAILFIGCIISWGLGISMSLYRILLNIRCFFYPCSIPPMVAKVQCSGYLVICWEVNLIYCLLGNLQSIISSFLIYNIWEFHHGVAGNQWYVLLEIWIIIYKHSRLSLFLYICVGFDRILRK